MERKEVAWYAVRCCCTPQRIFGFLRLELAGTTGRPKSDIRHIEDCFGKKHMIQLRSIYLNKCIISTARGIVEGPTPYPEEIAVYSDDRPIEFWRTIDDFVEASNGQD